MNKSGLSGVLIMVLLILLAIAGVVIIWGFAKTFVLSSSEDISTSSVIFSAVFDGYVSKYNEYETQLNVDMDINLVKIAGDLDSDKLRIIFEDKEGDRFERIIDVGFKLYEGKKVSVLFSDILSLSGGFDSRYIVKIYVYPIYVLESGKQKIGETPTILVRENNVFKSKTKSSSGAGSTPQIDNLWCGNADINRDGKVDSLDNKIMSDYYGVCFAPSSCLGLDMNGDGIVNSLDNDICSSLSWCSGADITRDGKVDTFDLQIMGIYFGKKCNLDNSFCDGSDLDGNNEGSIGDVTIFSEKFGDGVQNDVICEDGVNGNECCQNNDIDGDGKFDSDDLTALKDSLGRTGCSGSSAVCSYL